MNVEFLLNSFMSHMIFPGFTHYHKNIKMHKILENEGNLSCRGHIQMTALRYGLLIKCSNKAHESVSTHTATVQYSSFLFSQVEVITLSISTALLDKKRKRIVLINWFLVWQKKVVLTDKTEILNQLSSKQTLQFCISVNFVSCK